jgi:hypothetical protein
MTILRARQGYTYEWVKDKSLDADEKRLRLTKALSEDLGEGDLASAEVLVRVVVDIDRHAVDLLNELNLVPERIIGDNPATYERWDRLSAEAEFRQAIVPPLFALMAVLVVRGTLSLWFGLLLAALPLIMLTQGIDKEHAAKAQLLQTLEADIVQVVPLQRLTTTDLHRHPADYWNSEFDM